MRENAYLSRELLECYDFMSYLYLFIFFILMNAAQITKVFIRKFKDSRSIGRQSPHCLNRISLALFLSESLDLRALSVDMYKRLFSFRALVAVASLRCFMLRSLVTFAVIFAAM